MVETGDLNIVWLTVSEMLRVECDKSVDLSLAVGGCGKYSLRGVVTVPHSRQNNL